jgi:hypothetical protein
VPAEFSTKSFELGVGFISQIAELVFEISRRQRIAVSVSENLAENPFGDAGEA